MSCVPQPTGPPVSYCEASSLPALHPLSPPTHFATRIADLLFLAMPSQSSQLGLPYSIHQLFQDFLMWSFPNYLPTFPFYVPLGALPSHQIKLTFSLMPLPFCLLTQHKPARFCLCSDNTPPGLPCFPLSDFSSLLSSL